LKVRLYRPFDPQRFVAALPSTTKAVAALDRGKEPGSAGEPLYLDCVNALHEALDNGWGELNAAPKVIGGRYGALSQKIIPAEIKAVFCELSLPPPQKHFTIRLNADTAPPAPPYVPQDSTHTD